MKRLSKIIEESIWSDIHKRSTGEQIRKEDDINFFDNTRLLDYLKNNYRIKCETIIAYSDGSIFISLFSDDSGYDAYVSYDIDHDLEICLLGSFKETLPDVCDSLNDKYKLTKKEDYDLFGHPREWLTVEPKDNNDKITNRFFIEVLDFIIERIPKQLKPFIKKNEEAE